MADASKLKRLGSPPPLEEARIDLVSEPHERRRVASKTDTRRDPELLDAELDDFPIEVGAAEMCVATDSFDFEYALFSALHQ